VDRTGQNVRATVEKALCAVAVMDVDVGITVRSPPAHFGACSAGFHLPVESGQIDLGSI